MIFWLCIAGLASPLLIIGAIAQYQKRRDVAFYANARADRPFEGSNPIIGSEREGEPDTWRTHNPFS
jgi:hypothetical protein